MNAPRGPQNLIARRSFDAAELVATYPPRWRHPNKVAVYRKACPPECVHAGRIVFSRWAAFPVPEALEGDRPAGDIEGREDVFDYRPTMDGTAAAEWHLNFAAAALFCAYGTGLLAQDEMQVAEHPALGSLKEALSVLGESILTVEGARPTPILVTGVERRCRIATNPDPAAGRPDGLYGNRFALADVATVERATQVLAPPTVSNIIAMEAPSYGMGAYRRHEIDFILSTAFSGFSAACRESREELRRPRVVIHTGFWGCGAYGGNRVLMALLQILAARLARVNRLVFHTVDPSGSGALAEAIRILDADLASSGRRTAVPGILDRIEAVKFRWGVSDGN